MTSGVALTDRAAELVLAAIAVGWCAMRFIGLEHVPLGAAGDEAVAGLHVECLAQTGADADGQRWPLFANGFGEGLYTPAYLYALFLWTRLFGIAMASLRAFSATMSLAALAGVVLLARRLVGRRAGLLAGVAGALSPWSFQVARLADDAPTAPAFLVWGVYCFVRSARWTWAAAAGVLFTLAAYTYPPVRVTAPLVMVMLLVVERRRLSRARVGAFLGSAAIVSIPLGLRILSGQLLARPKALSIFNIDYINANRGELGRVTFIVKQILENLFEHLRPSYLFFTGDANLRHSTQIMGELGWLDILAVAIFGLAIVTSVYRQVRPVAMAPERPSKSWVVAGYALLTAGFAVFPVALCHLGLPHALQSMAGWPAVALFTGVVLDAAWSRYRLVPVLAVVLAVAQSVHFVPYYFHVYPQRAYDWWDGPFRDAAASKDRRRFGELARTRPALGYRYYLMRYFGATCVSSVEQAQLIESGRW